MWRSTSRQKPRGLVIARSLAFASFAGLAVSTLIEGNYFLSSLFLVLSLYYLKKLIWHRESEPKQIPQTPGKTRDREVAVARAELASMLAYYRRLAKGWKIITVAGWAATALMLGFFRTPFIVVILVLAGYATYAFLRCQKAVNLIEGAVGRGRGD